MASTGHQAISVSPEDQAVFLEGCRVRVWQPEYAPQPVTGQLLGFDSRGPRVLMEQMVVMDRTRALHLEFLDSGVQMQIAGQHCCLRSDPQGRGWLLVGDCVPWIPEQALECFFPGEVTSFPEKEQVILRWEGAPRATQAVPLLAQTRQGICFTASSPPEIGRRLACQLGAEDTRQPLIAQVQWFLQVGDGPGIVGAEFLPGQRVDHLPEPASSGAERSPVKRQRGHASARWWPVAGILLMILALWLLLGM